jgi:hypothetical protein
MKNELGSGSGGGAEAPQISSSGNGKAGESDQAS